MLAFKPEEHNQLQLVDRDEIDDEEELFEMIDKLTNHGINAGDVKKLQDAGIYTCNGLMMHTKKDLTGIKGLSEAKVDKICEAAEKIVNLGYITGSDALIKRKSVICKTGNQALDELLGGGIETSSITEAFGEFRPEEHNQLQLADRDQELFEMINKLINHGINAGDVMKLQDAGIDTWNGVMMHTKKNLTGITGLSEAKVDKICEAAEKIVNFGYITGSDALIKEREVKKLNVHLNTMEKGNRTTLEMKKIFELKLSKVVQVENEDTLYNLQKYIKFCKDSNIKPDTKFVAKFKELAAAFKSLKAKIDRVSRVEYELAKVEGIPAVKLLKELLKKSGETFDSWYLLDDDDAEESDDKTRFSGKYVYHF